MILGACGAVEARHETVDVGGNVHGLWDGADGVALRLEAAGVNALVTATANGPFAFAQPVARGAAYTVTVAASPSGHACTVDGAGAGIADDAITTVSVACRGPDVAISLSSPDWTFDPTEDSQRFSGSVAVQDVTLTVTGTSLTGVTVAGGAAAVGKPSAAIALPLGETTVPVAMIAGNGLSKTYQLVFDRGGTAIAQAVYAKASNTGANDVFGTSIALSGNTLAVGAFCEASSAVGANGNQGDNTSPCSGAVYVFVRDGATWTQQAYLKASNSAANDFFGTAVALAGDTLAVGATGEDGAVAGVNVNQADNNANSAGAVYVFVRAGATWTQQAYIKASNPEANDEFGATLALSGNTLAVGAAGEDSAAQVINGNQADNTAPSAGAVYVFARSGSTWTQQAYVKASNAGAGDLFGFSVALSDDTLVVGADAESSSATGIDGNQVDNGANSAGAVYAFTRSGMTWSQQAYIKASNTNAGDFFGSAVALAGNTLAVGAYHESSAATGIDGNQADNSAGSAGAVYLFERSGTSWMPQAYLKASNAGAGDLFGASLALSGDTLAVGAYHESSSATGTDGNQADNTGTQSGAAYVFVRRGATWSQRAYLKASNTGASDLFGWSLALSGGTLAISAYQEASGASGLNAANGQSDEGSPSAGAVYLFR